MNVELRNGSKAESGEVRRISSELRLLDLRGGDTCRLLLKFRHHCAGSVQQFTSDQLRLLDEFDLVMISPQGFEVPPSVRNVVLSLVRVIDQGRYALENDACVGRTAAVSI